MQRHALLLLWLQAVHQTTEASAAAYPFEKVAFIGRWWSEDGAMHASWGTVAFEVTFKGSERLIAKLKPYAATMYHTCRINGREFVLARRTGDLVIATGLPRTERHTIWCGRNTEAYYGKTVLEALLVDDGAEILEPPSLENQLRVEFIGDSITAGWVVLNAVGTYENQNQTGEDIFQTWDRHLADAWNTDDWRAVARTGIAVFSYSAYGLQFHRIKDRFLCSEWNAAQCCPRPWDFSKWQADVVVINVGTNDYIPLNPNNPTAATFQEGYAELLTAVRGKYPSALIFCIMPLIYTCDRDSRYDAMHQGLRAAVLSLADERIRLQSTGTREAPWLNCFADYVDGTHPTVDGGRKFAERLLPGLTPEVRRYFPEKCPGSGQRCGALLVPTSRTTRSTTTTGVDTTSATGFSSTTTAGDATCCYPTCNNPQKVCNNASQSPFCTSSSTNCQACGGELCTGGSPTTATPTPPTTVRTTVSSTSETTTTAGGGGSTSRPSGAMACCYPDCADPQNVCNTESQSPFCTSSAANCQACGGQLCARTTSQPVTPSPGTTSTAATSTAGGGPECCYPDCANPDKVCNNGKDSPFCTSSPANCQQCGGQLCTTPRREIFP